MFEGGTILEVAEEWLAGVQVQADVGAATAEAAAEEEEEDGMAAREAVVEVDEGACAYFSP